MALVHRGLQEFTGDEVSNLFLGQAGFTMIVSSAVYAAETSVGTTSITEGGGPVSHTNKDVKFWCAIKAVGGAAVVNARSILSGDDFNTSGDYASSGDITLADGDIVYGAFDAIAVTGSGNEIIAYIGK